MAFCGGAFKVWLVEILTTVGNSLLASSAKESGAARPQAGDKPRVATIRVKKANRIREEDMSVPGDQESTASLGREQGNKQAKTRFWLRFFCRTPAGNRRF